MTKNLKIYEIVGVHKEDGELCVAVKTDKNNEYLGFVFLESMVEDKTLNPGELLWILEERKATMQIGVGEWSFYSGNQFPLSQAFAICERDPLSQKDLPEPLRERLEKTLKYYEKRDASHLNVYERIASSMAVELLQIKKKEDWYESFCLDRKKESFPLSRYYNEDIATTAAILAYRLETDKKVSDVNAIFNHLECFAQTNREGDGMTEERVVVLKMCGKRIIVEGNNGSKRLINIGAKLPSIKKGAELEIKTALDGREREWILEAKAGEEILFSFASIEEVKKAFDRRRQKDLAQARQN